MSTVEKVVGEFIQGIYDRSVTSEFKDFLRWWAKIKFEVKVNFLVSRILNLKSAMMSDEAHDEVKRFASVPNSGQYWKIALEELESLKQTSDMIQFLSDEAEVKQFTSVAVKVWLDHLKQLLYDADDILDDYATELVRLKFESAHPTQLVRNSVPLTPSSTESSVSYFLKFGIESAVKGINERFEGIKGIEDKFYNFAEELQGIKSFGSRVRGINQWLKNVATEGGATGLNLSKGSGSSRPRVVSQRPPTSSSVDNSNVFGRKDNMCKIVNWLLSDETSSLNNNGNNFSVLPIVGMGGSGKTTLAQLVYNCDRVKKSKYFDLRVWVCVSEDFDVVRLTTEILKSATGSTPPDDDSLEALQLKLELKFNMDGRFLLVLDDVWNGDYKKWEALTTPFAYGKPGSKILITTRSKGIATMVRTGQEDHDLKGLSDEACFELIRKNAFMDENSPEANRKLEVFGKKIMEKCKGLPLAVKTLASLLQDKRENSEWEDILENEIWDHGEIFPSLMLSYHHLSPLLKRCFAYCALFPKDYIFNKIELVILWMAEGIIQPEGDKRLEDIGVGYFDELFMRSFFELSNNPQAFHPTFSDHLSERLHSRSFFDSSSNVGLGFVMHDLIHDLARFVSAGIYSRREYDNPSQILATTRHLSYLMDNCNAEAIHFEGMKSVRTLVTLGGIVGVPRYIFPDMQFHFLRVLHLRNCLNLKLSDSVGKLKHLRLLDLSFSNIEILPDSIGSLYNLQTLVLAGCLHLIELPKDMGNLVNLRHLFLPWGSYKMPLQMGNLTSLQTLSTFIVGSKNISELRDLSQLRGNLDILNLENVSNNGREAMVANLKNKRHLLGLRLRWSHYESADTLLDLGRDEKVEEDVLDQLQPPPNLEELWIVNYGGTRFPSWIECPFSNLHTLGLINCRKCKFLPHLKQLPLLKQLFISGCNAIKIVGSELYGDGSSSASKQFQSLEKLFIEKMEEWEEWPKVIEEEGIGQFPCLCHLNIIGCPKLRKFSHHFPSLVQLEIKECEDLRELPQLLPSVKLLDIEHCPKLVVFPTLPSIEKLILDGFDQIIPSSSSPPSSLGVGDLTRFLKFRALTVLDDDEQFDIIYEAPHDLSSNTEHLWCLDLSATSMKLLPQSLYRIQRLVMLKVCNNPELVSLPDDIHKLECLRFLDLSGTGIRVLPTTFGELPELCYLDLSYTPIEMLPESVVKLEELRTLKLSHCTSLSGSFHYMIGWKNIQCLDLSYTGIEMLPEFVGNLENLQRLSVEGCSRLAGLPSDIGTLSKGVKLWTSMPAKLGFHARSDLASFSSPPSMTIAPVDHEQQPTGQYSPGFLLNQLDYILRKMRPILENPEEMGIGDITLISSSLLQVLQRLEMSLTMLRDAELHKLGDPSKHEFLEHQPLFEGLGNILEAIASCVSEATPLIQLPLQGHERDVALDIINSIYDNSVALSNISLLFETIEMAGRPHEDPLLSVHTYHEIVQPKPGIDQVSSMDTKITEGSISEASNTSEVCKSFHNLPQHLKRCVIYTCILFLGDYEFEEDTLIQLWISVGFIRTGQEQLMERGRIYFQELHRLSIFQMSSIVCENYESTYRVHKDVYELIKQYCPNEYSMMDEGETDKISPVTLHSMLLLDDKICKSFDMKIFERFHEAELLRTLKLRIEFGSSIKHIPHNLFVKLKFLRVLDLSSTKIKELPTSVCKLRHLRYLDVSSTRMRKLPESLSKLYNLETLKLRNCSDLVVLPNEMSKLIHLQYLNLDGVHQLTSMPPRMGQLTNLQTLSIFVVGRQEGFRIEELKYMKKLRGSLCIAKMENVTKDQANEAQLGDKVAIHKLEFQWSSSQRNGEMEFILIEPHLSIEQLKITRYGAESFPNWLSSEKFYRLTVINLRNCNCTYLPDLGRLPSLKSLYMHEMHLLKEISHEFYGAFLKLEALKFDGMPCLEKWTAIKEYDMPSLHDLTIIDCPNLVTLPEFMKLKSLKNLRIILCPEIQAFPGERLPESLQSLTIMECVKLEEQCQEGKGKEWFKIAGIPEKLIEYQQISGSETSENPITDPVTED